MKRLIAILLALCLCISLAACGSNEEETQSKGDKMYKKYKELINFLEEGNFDAASDALSVLAGEDLDSTDFGELQDIFEYLQNENYTAAIAAIVRLENSKNQKEPTDMMALLCHQWYSADYQHEQMPVAKSVSFSDDGSCVIRDETLNWTVENEYPGGMSMKIYRDGTAVYSGSVSINEDGRAYLNVYDLVEETGIGNYYEHPMMHYLLSYSWQRLDDSFEELPESFYVRLDDLYFNDEDYDYKIVSDPEDAELKLEAYEKNTADPRFIIRIYVRDGRYVTDFTDTSVNATTLYYTDYTGGFSTDWNEYLYSCAIQGIQKFTAGNSFYFEDEYYKDNSARAKVYELLERCKGYKDAEALLANFTIFEKKISNTKFNFVDNLGNENNRDSESYSFDSSGRLLSCNNRSLEMLLFGSYGCYSSNCYITYDESGKVSAIQYGYSNSIRAYLTPAYDENSRICSIEVKTNSATFTNTFTYDAEGKLIHADYRDEDPEQVRSVDFTYDTSGRLTTMSGQIRYYPYSFSCGFRLEYIYNEAGHIASRALDIYLSDHNSYWNDWNVRYDYTCNEAGDPISATVTGSDYTNYASVVAQYIYNDLYFYQN